MQTDITLEDAKTVWIGMGTEYAGSELAESEVRLKLRAGGDSWRFRNGWWSQTGPRLKRSWSCGNGRIGVLGIDLRRSPA